MKINSIYSYKSIINLLTGTALLLGASGCTDSVEFDGPKQAEGESGSLTFRCADMLEVYKGENNYASRAGGPKNPAEKEIKTLHVFFFSMTGTDEDGGKLLTSSTYHNFPAYQRLDNDAAFLKIPTGEGVENLFEEGNSGIRIVAIANIHATDEANDATDAANMFKTRYSIEGKIQQDGREVGGDPYEITCYNDLKKWVYHPRIRMKDDEESDDNNISRLPSSGMPMIGEATNVDLNKKEAFVVNLRALMAKVNVSVKLEPKQYTATYPRLTITEYGVKNMPIAVPFTACTGELKEGGIAKPTNYQEYIDSYDVTTAPMYHNSDASEAPGTSSGSCDPADHEYTTTAGLPVTIDKDSPVQTFSYYTYENIQLPDYSAMRTDGITPVFNDDLTPNYPAGVQPEDHQRWKSTMAYTDRASALILKGDYITDQGLMYKAQFTVYMGSDSETDFQVKRNHRYDNNIVIHGLDYIRNSDDNAYTFDGRVNVHDTKNPFYLAIINERKVDAHATALPMDVWFMLRENGDGTVVDDPDWNSEITFTVRDHETVDWIRMEKVPRWDRDGKTGMENGGFKAGHGARNYFTTNLVTEELADNWTMTVRGGGESDANADGSRSRIYFYIDENVPASNNPTNYGDRTAIIDVEYKRTEENGEVVPITRTLEIEQRALVKVSGTWTGNDGTTDNIPETWMEYYEEYLEHSDPLDQHEMPGELYSGLPWGLNGVNVNYSIFNRNGFNNPENGNDAYHIYYKSGAFAMTQWDINRGDTQGVENLYLFNSNVPQSAFQYCYGKNKRNANGTAAVSGEKGWYMPGIRELEKALVDYYEDFVDFRGNLYWSASGTSSTANARATKVTINGTRITYAQSGNNGDEGYNPRTQANRIRAFYRVD